MIGQNHHLNRELVCKYGDALFVDWPMATVGLNNSVQEAAQ